MDRVKSNAHVLDDGRVLFKDSGFFHIPKLGTLSPDRNTQSCFGSRWDQMYKPVSGDLSIVPRSNIGILITGSRGDVQPFIALGQTL